MKTRLAVYFISLVVRKYMKLFLPASCNISLVFKATAVRTTNSTERIFSASLVDFTWGHGPPIIDFNELQASRGEEMQLVSGIFVVQHGWNLTSKSTELQSKKPTRSFSVQGWLPLYAFSF
jgi:hypothetical protein